MYQVVNTVNKIVYVFVHNYCVLVSIDNLLMFFRLKRNTKFTMQKYMSKSEVRCASLLNNILDGNIDIDEILAKLESFENVSLYRI